MTPSVTAAQEVHTVVELVPLEKIAESPTNPRKTFAGIEDLAESVKQHGILQPVLLRPMKGVGANLYQLVFGARRYRAAKLAGLDAIPAMVRDLSDIDALETQIVENSKREDVHPLEEAEGYEVLVHSKDRKYTVEEIAAKVGKSAGYVYGRMKLLALCKEVREAYYDGKFTASSAILVARLSEHGVQRAVLKDLNRFWQKGEGAFSLHEVSRVVRQHLCRLADAPFSKDDADLVPAAGPCSSCPKRSGAQPELFADISKQDGELCTDPACYEKKKEAMWKRRSLEAEAKGLKVLEGKAAQAALHGREYVRLDYPNYNDPKHRTWKQLVGKVAKDKIVLARTDDGEVRELVPAKETKKLLKAAGHDFKAERSLASRYSRPSESVKEKEARALRDGLQAGVAAAFVERLKTKGPDLALWKIAALQMARDFGDEVFERRLGEEKSFDSKTRSAHIEALDETQLRALTFELALEPVLYFDGYSKDQRAARERLLKWAGIDVKKVEAEVKARRASATAEPKMITDLVGTREEAIARHKAKKTGTAAKLAKGAKKKGARRG